MGLFKKLVHRILGDPYAADPVSFDLTNWTQTQLEDGQIAFRRPPGDLLLAQRGSDTPDIPVALNDLDGIRATYGAEIRSAGAGVVSIETHLVDGVRAIQTISKVPQQPSGMTYTASVTIPFRDSFFVINVACRESGPTGLRDSTVAMKLDIETDESGFVGWMADPYEPNHSGPVLRNLSDDETWDEMFPEPPLSRLRRILAELRESIRIHDDLRSTPFEGTRP